MIIKKSNKIQLHYYFSDNLHGFDANVRNECEKEILQIFNEVSKSLELNIFVEAQPAKDGGFIELWNFLGTNSNQITLIVSIVAIFISRLPVENKKLTQLQIENLELDNKLKKEELKKLNLGSLVNKEINDDLIRKVIDFLNLNYKIVWRRSNFYKKVISYKRIDKLSIQRYDDSKPVGNERINKKADFYKYILDNDDLPDVKHDEAEIDIISPVLKPGRFIWKGFYQKDIISFHMLDKEFSQLVQQGKIKLNNKVSIRTQISQSRKIDENGAVKTTKTNVITVIEYIVDGVVTITNKGHQFRNN